MTSYSCGAQVLKLKALEWMKIPLRYGVMACDDFSSKCIDTSQLRLSNWSIDCGLKFACTL